MKSRLLLIFVSIICIGSNQSHADDYYPPLITLIAELANMSVMASQCEEQLINYGSKAMEGKECLNFLVSFNKKWPDRKKLEDEIVNIVSRIEKGELNCDDRCRNMLTRCEELRITITYVLDYMDYVVEEEL